MSKVRIVTDSISDIPPDICRQLEIEVVPAVVVIGGKTYRDKVDLSDADFYRQLKESDELPTTSQPPVGEFEAVYQRLAQETNQIISIHIPETVSGTLAAARAAASNIDSANITVVDSTQISMAEGWLTIMAARAAQAGHAVEEILDLIRETIPRLRLSAALDTLEYARRGGRIGRAAAMMGTLLRVKPLIGFENGEVVPLENARTMRRAIDRLLQMASEWLPLEEVAVIHAAAPELAARVRERLGELHPIERIPITEAGPV
ncbi:MAG: DegV family protein, partial [Chloroflexi bacterium]